MKSKASIKSHPIHPILVAFPITLFTGTFVFDILTAITGNETFARTGLYLNIGGIACALLAAIPGIIDYFYTVPPQSSAKKRATKHGALNLLVTVLFTLSFFLKSDTGERSVLMLVIEALAIGLMLTAGWLGGTLVYRNQIGVDTRYADAGKWKELHIDARDQYILVAQVDDLKVNQMKLVVVNGKRIVLGRTETGYTAFDDRCTHRGGSLAAGVMICSTVQCPWHGSQFDVRSGVVTAGPAAELIHIYKVKVEGQSVYLISDEAMTK
jgi:uncharacterized membrane protein/nitrite reductase/ring-hydroxylating ferredoxin subunit